MINTLTLLVGTPHRTGPGKGNIAFRVRVAPGGFAQGYALGADSLGTQARAA